MRLNPHLKLLLSELVCETRAQTDPEKKPLDVSVPRHIGELGRVVRDANANIPRQPRTCEPAINAINTTVGGSQTL